MCRVPAKSSTYLLVPFGALTPGRCDGAVCYFQSRDLLGAKFEPMDQSQAGLHTFTIATPQLFSPFSSYSPSPSPQAGPGPVHRLLILRPSSPFCLFVFLYLLFSLTRLFLTSVSSLSGSAPSAVRARLSLPFLTSPPTISIPSAPLESACGPDYSVLTPAFSSHHLSIHCGEAQPTIDAFAFAHVL